MILCVRFKDAPSVAALAVLEGVSPAVQRLAPDCYLVDAHGAERYFGTDAAGVASLVRVRALAHAGAECAIGVAPTPMLAGMAAREATQGTTLVVPDGPRETVAFLAPKPVDALPGVGAATARALRAYGLGTVAKAADVPLSTLQRILGTRLGREVHEKAHGIDRTGVVPDAGVRGVSAHRDFPYDELDRDEQWRALLSCAEEIGARLRDARQTCRSVTLTVRYADGSATSRTRTLREPTAHTPDLSGAARRIHEALGLQRARVRAVALRADDLVARERATHQLSLDAEDERARRIEAVKDLVRARFGARAVGPGSLAA